MMTAYPALDLSSRLPGPVSPVGAAATGLLDYYGAQIRMVAETPAEQGLRLTACAKEPWTVRWIESMKPGEALYDIGANVGPYTLIAASLGLTVVAFEPGYANYARLCQNLALNRLLDRVICLPIALGQTSGLVRMRYSNPAAGWASHRLERPESAEGQFIACLTLDEAIATFQLPPPDHIKLDVDGAEAAVIAGAARTLRDEHLASLMMEIQRDNETTQVAQLGESGLGLRARYDTRGGAQIPGIIYALFQRNQEYPRCRRYQEYSRYCPGGNSWTR